MTSNLTADTCSRRWTSAFVGALVVAGCVRQADPLEPDFPTRYGLQPSHELQPLAASAVDTANRILGATAGGGLRYGWNSPAAGPGAKAATPVYVVGAEGLAKQEVAFVTRQCAAIMVQAPAFERWLAQYQSEDSLQADPAVMLAFLLLHEAGHIHNRDCNGYQFEEHGGSFNIDTNVEKIREITADRFAAEALRKAAASDWAVRQSALNVEMAVSTFSFLVSGQRIVTHPGSSLLPSQDVFWDRGLSHPNLEWRLLSVNYQLNPSPTAKQLLDEFETHRQSIPDVLYQKTDSH